MNVISKLLPWRGTLQALRVFLPGVLLVIILLVLFTGLEQGRDIVRQTFESGVRMVCLGLTTIFLAYVTWYGARLSAFGQWERLRLHPNIRKLGPRLLGHCTYMAALVGIMRMGPDLTVADRTCEVILVIVLDLVWFMVLRWSATVLMDRVGTDTRKMERYLRLLLIVMFSLAFSLAIPGAIPKVERLGPMLIIILMQACFAILVHVRGNWLRAINPEEGRFDPAPSKIGLLDRLFPRDRNIGSAAQEEMLPYATEKRHFIYFNLISLSVFAIMVVVWSIPQWASVLGAFAIVWVSLALIHGTYNFLANLTVGTGIPIGLLLIALMLFMGRDTTHHRIVVDTTQNSPEPRMDFDTYFEEWRLLHLGDTSAKRIPIVFVLADGGASRSGYWVHRVLERLHRSDPQFSNSLFSLSGASGGAVGIASYYQHAALGEFETGMTKNALHDTIPLGEDLLSGTISHMLGPDLLNLAFPFTADRAHALELCMERSDPLWKKPVRELFDPRASAGRPILCLNTTRMDDGQPAVVCSVALDSISGRVDVLSNLDSTVDMHLSAAAVMSSRFPYVSPAGYLEWDKRKHYFVDGGYFDNSGAGATLEMLLHIEKLATVCSQADVQWFKRLYPLVVHISNTAPPRDTIDAAVHDLANDMMAPMLTVLGTYASQTNINDTRLRSYMERIYCGRAKYIKVDLYEEAKELEFSMNWSMSQLMRHTMDSLALKSKDVERVLSALRP